MFSVLPDFISTKTCKFLADYIVTLEKRIRVFISTDSDISVVLFVSLIFPITMVLLLRVMSGVQIRRIALTRALILFNYLGGKKISTGPLAIVCHPNSFEYCISTCSDGVIEILESGFFKLGVDSITVRIVQDISDRIPVKAEFVLKTDSLWRGYIIKELLASVISLSSQESFSCYLPCETKSTKQFVLRKTNLTLKAIQKILANAFNELLEPFRKCRYHFESMLYFGDSDIGMLLQLLISCVFNYELQIQQMSLNDMSVGGALYNGVLSSKSHFLLLDCTDSAISVLLYDGTFFDIVEKNTTVPIIKTGKFRLFSKNSEVLSIFIYESNSNLRNLIGYIQLPVLSSCEESQQNVKLTVELGSWNEISCTITNNNGQLLEELILNPGCDIVTPNPETLPMHIDD